MQGNDCAESGPYADLVGGLAAGVGDDAPCPMKEEQLQRNIDQFQAVIESGGHVPGFLLGPSTTEYAIRDFDINQLPEKNPMQRVIDDFVSRRH